jgi:hypothetical protein
MDEECKSDGEEPGKEVAYLRNNVLTHGSSSVNPGRPITSSFNTSPPMPIHSLPLETIGRIIESTCTSLSNDRKERRARRHFLLATSLVCRTWTPFAQPALWKYVCLEDAVSAALLVGTGAGRYPIKVLRVNLPGQDEGTLETLLRTVRGVQQLDMVGGHLKVDWLCGTNLQGEWQTGCLGPACH